ncbi:MAG: long-chain-fatty-acid--CoA ligase [Paracoccaceae bacterium]
MFGGMMTQPLTIGSLVDHAGKYHADTEIVSVATAGGTDRTNWAQVARRSRLLASALGRMGIEPGACCGTIAWNNFRHLEIYFGVSGGGMICHTINPRLFPEQLVYVINHAEDEVIFLDKTFLPIAARLADSLKTVKAFVLMGPRDAEAAGQVPGLLFYEDLIADGQADYDWPELDENEASSICYTSGTTGVPKGVMYSHRSTVLHAFVMALPDSGCLSARDSILPVVPMFHVNAWGVPYSAAMMGSRLILPGPGLDGERLLRLINEEKVTIAFGVPTIWQGLLAAMDKSGRGIGCLKRTLIGGAAVPPSMMSEFRDRYGVEVIHGWGMTETSPLVTANALKAKHLSQQEDEQAARRLCQGRPVFGTEIRIADENGETLPEDGRTEGELMVRGHWVVGDYFKAEPGSTLSEGWFPTGDIATIDADGYMTIRDRSKDVIKSGGEWISSVELEGIAAGHPAIAEAAVIAARHDKWGERPLLLAVKAPGADVAPDALLSFFEGKVAKWQIPDAVVFVEALPRNATGKILKTRLREEHGDALLAG